MGAKLDTPYLRYQFGTTDIYEGALIRHPLS